MRGPDRLSTVVGAESRRMKKGGLRSPPVFLSLISFPPDQIGRFPMPRMPPAVRIIRKEMPSETPAALTYSACGKNTAEEDPEATRVITSPRLLICSKAGKLKGGTTRLAASGGLWQ